MKIQVTATSPRYGRASAVAEILDCHPSAVWRKAAADPTFPQPINLSRRHTVFDLNRLDAWLAARVENAA